MEKIAFINGGTFIYWSSIILALAVAAAIALFCALYLNKSGNVTGLALAIPVALFSSIVLGRLVHWYCRADGYESMQAALTDYTWGGYALMGIFGGCLLTACLLRLLRVVKNLPEMLDCMVLSGGVGIAVGRLSSLFNSSDRGVIVPENMDLPFAYPVTNAVSGVVENRLATFMIQSMLVGIIVMVLAAWIVSCKVRKKNVPDGDVTLLFLLAYGGSQIVCDSTRYDALYMRSNGFISIVQILGLIALLLAIILFSIRMVKHTGFKIPYIGLWVVIAALIGCAAFMEYYVQRHGDQALFAYSIMSACILVVVILTVGIRCLAVWPKKEVPAAQATI